eukprot:gnl/Spiro4/29725_TR14599_c0_g1_i1.p1 gnl/Spiro4/29725_TR14599_c0_g1~~gnl/Spiro4/29725_TR14599_c0_g1_i1.p1  ORF type:complete len:1590 (-),score=337.19 gnl/Spiro4/29725_TR14599_c0_g1_i1:22-4635(-)
MDANTSVNTTDPIRDALAHLEANLKASQEEVAHLTMQRRTVERQAAIAELKTTIENLEEEIALLSSFVAKRAAPSTSSTTPPQARASVSPQHSRRAADSTGASSSTAMQNNKLPSNLPKFQGTGSCDVDDFVEELTNNLIADDINPARWASALLKSCTLPADAAWVKDNVLGLPWDDARELFLNRYRDPLRLQRLQKTFYSLRKPSTESMRAYAARFEKMAHSLGLSSSRSLIAQFVSTLAEPLATHLQMYSISNTGASLTDIIRTAISIDSSSVPPTTAPPPHQERRESTRRFHCSYHGANYSHNTPECRSTSNAQSTALRRTGAPLPPATAAAKSPAPSDPICYNCKRPGHLARSCPVSSRPPSGPCTRCNQVGHWSSQCPTITHDERSPPVTHARMQVGVDTSLTTTAHCESADTASVSLPVTVGGHAVTALVDTGASHSFLDLQLAYNVGCPISPSELVIGLGSADATAPNYGLTSPLTCSTGAHTTLSPFYVTNLPTGLKCVIGRDIYPQLGIRLKLKQQRPPPDNATQQQCLLQPSAEVTQQQQTPPQEVEEEAAHVPPPEDNDSQQQRHPHSGLPEAIQELLSNNTAIHPAARCAHPDALIHLDTGEAEPVYRRPYRVPQTMEEPVNAVIENWLKDGVIEPAPAGCRWNSPLVTKLKANGEVRVCIDPRPLNARLQNGDRFPIPIIPELIDRFAQGKVFSSLDLKSGFHQFTVHHEDRHKLAFTWRGIQYVFAAVPFGISHISSAFQRVLSSILAHLPFVVTYIDNIYVISPDRQQHMADLERLLRVLNDNNLRLNLKKCRLATEQVEVLGFVISPAGVSIDPTKLAGIEDVPAPETAKQMQSFLGFANFFRRHIPAFATLAAPLDPLRQQSHFRLNEEQLRAFAALKCALQHASTLALPDFSRPFALLTDASSTGVGAVLIQPPPDSPDFPNPPDHTCPVVAFFSRALTKSERNYATNKRELLAVVFGLKKCRYYLWGRPFELYTDHRSLTFLLSQQDLSPLLSHWFNDIMEFTFTIKHIPGVQNVLPDALSRLYPIPQRPEAHAELNVLQLLPEEPKLLREVPANERPRVLEEAHSFGHLGAKAVAGRIREQGISWPSLAQDAHDYVASCLDCQRFSIRRRGFHPLTSITADQPMFHVAIDCAGPLPETPRGNVYLFVAVCLFTRFAFLRPIPNKEAHTIAATLYDIFCMAGFPQVIQSDNGCEFVNGVIEELLRTINADHRLTTAYHPRANGVAERHVGLAIKSLRKSLKGATVDWDLKTPGTQLALNTRVCELHGSAPFSLFYGRPFPNFRAPGSQTEEAAVDAPHATTSPEDVRRWLETVTQLEEVVYPAVREHRNRINDKRASRFKQENKIVSFAVGSYVMALDNKRANKLDPFYEGPYRIVRAKAGTYTLQDHDGVLLHRNYAPCQLIPVPTPKPTAAVESSVGTIEQVLDHRAAAAGSDYDYLVKWEDLSADHNSWVPSSDFYDFNAVATYWKNRRNQPTGPLQPRRRPGRPRRSPEVTTPQAQPEGPPRRRPGRPPRQPQA